MLYLVATPIGNLGDFTYRAREVVERCDYVLCEDTRRTSVLLDHYQIRRPLRSYHAFNEVKELERVLSDLAAGQEIALLSDAGTPLISDPGFLLVKECRARKIPLTALPGPCASIDALVLSGLPTTPFQWVGFLPKKSGELRTTLVQALFYSGTTVAYEAPHRLIKTLTMLLELAPQRLLGVGRELTKLYEEILSGTAEELLTHFQAHEPRGECVLLIAPPPQGMLFENYTPLELAEMLEKEFKLSRTEALKRAAELKEISKRQLYQQVHKN